MWRTLVLSEERLNHVRSSIIQHRSLAQKVRLVLEEKTQPWTGHELNLRLEISPTESLKLNPNGVVRLWYTMAFRLLVYPNQRISRRVLPQTR